MNDKHKQAALRVLAEQRDSRALKAGHYRKHFGDRLTKALTAEVEQLEVEIEGIDETVKLIQAQ